MGEVAKAKARREREGFFAKYVDLTRPGIDIGCGDDPLNAVFRRYDRKSGDGDATHLREIPDESFHQLFSSHLLEHLDDPWTALHNWMRVLVPGGFATIVVPHRELYEKRARLPSRWNGEHKHFYLPDDHEPPDTLGLRRVIREAIPQAEVVYLKVCDEGWQDLGPDVHSCGEYSIEAVVRKPVIS